jgi:hypothetical protein
LVSEVDQKCWLLSEKFELTFRQATSDIYSQRTNQCWGNVLDSGISAKYFRIQQNRKTTRYQSVVVSNIISVMQNMVSVEVCHTKEWSRRVIKP